ncbi:MAG: HAD hydrolase-like protein, partial [Clostridia bacterium]
MSNYDTILFDLDGTLFDTESGVKKSISYCLDAFGYEYTPEVLHAMIGPPFRVSMKKFFGVDPENSEKFIKKYREHYTDFGWYDCKPFDGVEQLLIDLKSAGFRLAVATSKPIFFTNQIINKFGFDKYFDFVGGALSDCSRDTKSSVINFVLEGLNIEDKSKVVIVGDRLYDIEGAHLSGIDSIAILWGYGNLKEFNDYKATYILDTPSDV